MELLKVDDCAYQKQAREISYMDVKMLSECVEAERRFIRIQIAEFRQFEMRNIKNQQKSRNIVCFSTLRQKQRYRRIIRKSFQRYAHLTRLYHDYCRYYLADLQAGYEHRR